MKSKKLVRVIHQGSVVVNNAFIINQSENVIALIVDLASKWAHIDSYFSGPDVRGISLGASGNTSYPHKTKFGTTEITFPKFKGYDIFCANISKYTLSVCLLKDGVV